MKGSKLDRARASMKKLKNKYKAGEMVRSAGGLAGGVAVGLAERQGALPAEIKGIPVKPIVAIALTAAGVTMKDASAGQAFVLGAGTGVAGAYGYQAAATGQMLSGM